MKPFYFSAFLMAIATSGHAQILQELAPGERPSAQEPFYSMNVEVIDRNPQAAIDPNSETFIPGVVEFEWADDTPVIEGQIAPPAIGEQRVLSPIQPPKALPDTNPFAFREPTEDQLNNPPIETVETLESLENPTVGYQETRPEPNGESLLVNEYVSPNIFWVQNPTENPQEFALNVPEGQGKIVLVIGSDGLTNWTLDIGKDSTVEGILIIGPYAEHAQLNVRSISRVRSPVIRRKDIDPQNVSYGLSGGLQPQQVAVSSYEAGYATFIKNQIGN
jgi:hypothetical protein